MAVMIVIAVVVVSLSESLNPVSLSESHPEQQLEQLEVLIRAHNLLELEDMWGIW